MMNPLIAIVIALLVTWALPSFSPVDDLPPPDVSSEQCVAFACDCGGAPDRSGRWAECQCTCTEWASSSEL